MLNREEQRQQTVRELTSRILHLHYCKNDEEGLIALFSHTMSWFGAAEQEYLVGYDRIAAMFRQFAGKVPPCRITDEHYDVLKIAEDVYLCTGMLYIFTDPSTNIYIRVHQRVTTVFRWEEDGVPRCCHIHVSNPYSEMTAEDVGFPAAVSSETRKYMLEELDRKTLQLERLSYEDLLTGMYNRNRLNQEKKLEYNHALGLAIIDINGLKQVNDTFGHEAGDALIIRVAKHIRGRFEGKCYRIGGDEFVIMEKEGTEEDFRAALEQIGKAIEDSGDNASIGYCWREQGNFNEQLNEADNSMYENKRRYYMEEKRNRRRT